MRWKAGFYDCMRRLSKFNGCAPVKFVVNLYEVGVRNKISNIENTTIVTVIW